MSVPFVGPSYELANRKADISRAINLVLVGMETVGKAPFIMESIEGLILRASLGAEIRGTLETNDRAFVVAGDTLYEIFLSVSNKQAHYASVETLLLDDFGNVSTSGGVAMSTMTTVLIDGSDGGLKYSKRGTLATSTGPVQMRYGTSQAVMVDGQYGYVLTLGDNTFTSISADGFYGSASVEFINNLFTFIRPDTGQFEYSAINDATIVDPLNFATAELSPDNLVTQVVNHEDLWLFGTKSVEPWGVTGSLDLPFARRAGGSMDVGCIAAQSALKIDNTVMWLGRDNNGSGFVYKANGFVPQRVSTKAIEEVFAKSTDITQARAYAYQKNGQTFYCLNAPGVPTTWAYEISTGSWAERADLDELGQYKAHRAVVSLFAFGKHLVGDMAGNLYEFDSQTYTNAGDPLVRERISPHSVTAGRVRQVHGAFYADCTTGEAGQGIDPYVELSYSNDSGKSWSNPMKRSLGKVGEVFPRLFWNRTGMARDRVWRLRCSDPVPFSIIDAGSSPVKTSL